MLLAFASGCGGGAPRGKLEDNVFTKGPERFTVADLPTPWERARVGGDVAWVHAPTSAVIAANASCRTRRDVPLTILMNDLVIGTTHRRYLIEETATVDGHRGLHDVIAVQLDGVPLVLDLYVFRAGRCVYDLSLITPPAAYDAVADDFVGFVQGFRARQAG